MYDVDYGNYEDFKSLLINKRITAWDENGLVLDDGTVVTIECSEQDCCARAYGKFSDVKLDAMITDVSYPEVTNVPDDDTNINNAVVKIFHNQNPIAIANVRADGGNGGYYYSVGSFVVKGVHYQVVNV